MSSIGLGSADRRGLRFNRQCELQRRATVRILRRPQAAAVILDYRPHDDKAHTHPSRFGCEEGIEQTRHDLRVYALARIPN